MRAKIPIKVISEHTNAQHLHITNIYSLEYLINSWFWHWEFEEHPDEPDHDQWPWSPQDGKVAEPWYYTQHFKHLKDHRHPQEKHHAGIELAPVVLQIWYFSLQTKQRSAQICLYQCWLSKHH